jgi:hypothetical protein
MLRCARDRCDDPCVRPICSSHAIYIAVVEDCYQCLTTHCCSAWDACETSSSTCQSCLLYEQFEPSACCPLPLFKAVDDCVDTECAAECDQPGWWYDCSGGGWGGASSGGGGSGGGAG